MTAGNKNHHWRQRLWRLTSLTVPLWVCAVLLVLHAMYFARAMLVPIVFAVFAYLTLRPLVRRAQHAGIPAGVSAAAVMLLVLLIVGGGGYLVFEPAKRLIAEAPASVEIVKEKFRGVLHKVDDINDATQELAEVTEEEGPLADEKPVQVQVAQPAWTANWTLLNSTGNFLSFIAIAGALLYFLLATGDQLLNNILGSLPDFAAQRHLVEAVTKVQDGLSHYLAQVTIINFCLGAAVTLAMWGLRMPSPLLWGVMAMSFNYVPFLGALCGVVVTFFVALVNFEPTYYAFVVAGTYLLLTSLEGQFITPAILGKTMNTGPVLIMLSLVFWGWLWGLMGVFLSVPILIAVSLVASEYETTARLATLLGADGQNYGGKEARNDRSPQGESAEQAEAGLPSSAKSSAY